MKNTEIKKMVDNGTLIKHYPVNAESISIHTFMYKGSKYGWSSQLKHFIKVN